MTLMSKTHRFVQKVSGLIAEAQRSYSRRAITRGNDALDIPSVDILNYAFQS